MFDPCPVGRAWSRNVSISEQDFPCGCVSKATFMIYLDYNASVPLRRQAKDVLVNALDLEGNASSPHLAGRKLRALIDEARKDILKEMGAKRLVFTSGGTEANALALSGLG